MHAFGVDDTLQFLALFSCCLDVDQFKRAQVVWFWEVLKICHEQIVETRRNCPRS
jgi:chromatin segregation and condensation protein Rec8/ScpA/Scc1 (kleisin family)